MCKVLSINIIQGEVSNNKKENTEYKIYIYYKTIFIKRNKIKNEKIR